MAASLTTRQKQVLALLDQGLTAPEISDQLGITRNGVYAHILALKKKRALAQDWTPTGERRIPGDAHELVQYATQDMDVIKSLVDQNQRLVEMVDRLTQTTKKG